MQSGKFDNRVRFEQSVKITNGGGGFVIEWREMPGFSSGLRWAAIWPITQSKTDEEVTSSRVSNAPDYIMVVKSDVGTRTVKTDWRVVIDGQVFAIKSIARPDRCSNEIRMIIQEGQAT